ncbi:MAG: SRPBCC family protein [Nakamurella sp.]
MRMTGTMRQLDDTRGAVRVEDVYDTDIDDLWQACTSPERLARWIAEVSGDLVEGGTVQAVFTSTWSGSLRIDACEAPHHLLLTGEPGADDETQMEAWLTAEGSRTRLVVEERGLPGDKLHFYGAGWQAHLEDLGRALANGSSVHPDGWSAEAAAPAWLQRWNELIPAYQKPLN